MKKFIISAAGKIHRYLSRSAAMTLFMVKVRNQCNVFINYHLNSGIAMESNGEYWLMKQVAPKAKIFMDIGANTGEWSKAFLSLMTDPETGILVEPSPYAVKVINKRMRDDITSGTIKIIPAAASNNAGTMMFFAEESAGETSSLVLEHSNSTAVPIEIETTTVDNILADNKITFIDMLKIDAEGYDLKVIEGAMTCISNKAVGVIQFEYNNPWKYTGSTLFQAIKLLNDNQYSVYLLKAGGLYNFDYEKFGEYFGYSNFVAIAPGYLSIAVSDRL